MTIAEAQGLYDLAMNKAAQAASEGRFERAAGYVAAAALYWKQLDAMKTAIENMKGIKQ